MLVASGDGDVQTNVFITVDTEVWPKSNDWRDTCLAADMDRDIYAVTSEGEYGIRYQLDVFTRFDLKAVFFVEALSAEVVGRSRLAEIVHLIQSHGQEVQLHVHPEWLQWMAEPLVPHKRSQYLKQFTKDEQSLMLAAAIDHLRACGVTSVRAFRAGNYGANLDTLRALRENGVLFDTSYNYPYLSTQCGIDLREPLLQPRSIEGVMEYPITFYEDWPRHHRHLQITACSIQEMEHVLLQANRERWQSVVLVSHSFELVKNRKTPGKPLLPDHTCVNRFERLCRFLSERRDLFRTATFNEMSVSSNGDLPPRRALKSNVFRTGQRSGVLALRRL